MQEKFIKYWNSKKELILLQRGSIAYELAIDTKDKSKLDKHMKEVEQRNIELLQKYK